MNTEIKFYNIKDFVRKNVSGEFDLDKSIELARKIAGVALLNANHNVLLDMRDTTISSMSIIDAMKVSLEIAGYIPDFKNKIANVIPDDDERLRTARQFQSCMILKGFTYEVFTDFEEAIEWLSETYETN